MVRVDAQEAADVLADLLNLEVHESKGHQHAM
jgi:hypothetical protein